jgi:hypothetical protein
MQVEEHEERAGRQHIIKGNFVRFEVFAAVTVNNSVF